MYVRRQYATDETNEQSIGSLGWLIETSLGSLIHARALCAWHALAPYYITGTIQDLMFGGDSDCVTSHKTSEDLIYLHPYNKSVGTKTHCNYDDQKPRVRDGAAKPANCKLLSYSVLV
jgi:hypothetical protein